MGTLMSVGLMMLPAISARLWSHQIGIMLMAKAGYDPSEAPVFWERFADAKTGTTPMEWMSTHPSDVRRSVALRELMPEAMSLYEKAQEKLGIGEPVQ